MTTTVYYSAAQLAQHARDLAGAFGIALVEVPGLPPHAAACIDTRTMADVPVDDAVVVAPILDETTYAVALHEIGHVLCPAGRLKSEWSDASRRTGRPVTQRDWNLLVDSEQGAWDYAQHHALCWTDPMDFVRRIGLDSYTNGRATWQAAQQASTARAVSTAQSFAGRIQWHAGGPR